jgi:hypothetical protein
MLKTTINPDKSSELNNVAVKDSMTTETDTSVPTNIEITMTNNRAAIAYSKEYNAIFLIS